MLKISKDSLKHIITYLNVKSFLELTRTCNCFNEICLHEYKNIKLKCSMIIIKHDSHYIEAELLQGYFYIGDYEEYSGIPWSDKYKAPALISIRKWMYTLDEIKTICSIIKNKILKVLCVLNVSMSQGQTRGTDIVNDMMIENNLVSNTPLRIEDPYINVRVNVMFGRKSLCNSYLHLGSPCSPIFPTSRCDSNIKCLNHSITYIIMGDITGNNICDICKDNHANYLFKHTETHSYMFNMYRTEDDVKLCFYNYEGGQRCLEEFLLG